MIQRVQSIYLFLGAVAIVLFNFLTLGIDETPEPDVIVIGKSLLPILIGSIAIAAINIINIFLYSNRSLQMRVCRLNLFLTFGLIGLTIFLLFGNPSGAVETPGIGLAMPVFTVIFLFISLKKIGSDEKLVRSMDRLR